MSDKLPKSYWAGTACFHGLLRHIFWPLLLRYVADAWKLLVGTLSKDDDDGRENVGKKMNLRSFKFNRVYLDPRNMSVAGDFSWSWILKGFYSGSKRGRKIRRGMFTPSIKRQIRRFHVVVVHWTSKKCTKKRDARAELLFWSLNLFVFLKSSLWSSSWLLKLPSESENGVRDGHRPHLFSSVPSRASFFLAPILLASAY